MKLLELQRRMARAIMQPLGPRDRQSRKTRVEYIKLNDRLSALERLEIYSRSYWFRIIDSLYEDFPGLLAVLGAKPFDRAVRAYLADCPSRSYTLRDLGLRMGAWLKKHPRFAGAKLAVALDMIALECAHIEAWDAAERKALGPEDLIELGPSLAMSLQPHVRLLKLKFAVDEVRLRANRTAEEHEAASNAPAKLKKRRAFSPARLKREPLWMAVHRSDFSIYYRRLEREEFELLQAIRASTTIGDALALFYKTSSMPVDDLEPRIGPWFAIWAELGWLVAPAADADQ